MIYNHVLCPWTLFRATRTILGLVVPFWPLLVILGHFRPFWCCFGPFQGPRGSLNGPMGGPIWHIIIYYVPENCFRATGTILGLVGPFCHFWWFWIVLVLFWAVLGPRWVPKWPHGWANITYNHALCPWEQFEGHWDHFGPCWAIFATFGDFGPF